MKMRMLVYGLLAVFVGTSICYADGAAANQNGEKIRRQSTKRNAEAVKNDVQGRQTAIKDINGKAASFRAPKFTTANNLGGVSSRQKSFQSGTKLAGSSLQVQHMQRIMRGQVDYAVNTGGGSLNVK